MMVKIEEERGTPSSKAEKLSLRHKEGKYRNCHTPEANLKRSMKMKLYWEKKKKEMRKRIGEERINSKGDVEVRIKPGMRNSCWKEKKILVMDKSLMETRGFPLLDCEGVRHKDGDKKNNSEENLQLVFLKGKSVGDMESFQDWERFVGKWLATYGTPPKQEPFR